MRWIICTFLPVRRHVRELVTCLVGPIPDDRDRDHRCKPTLWCNPAHLQVVTSAENTRRGSATTLTADLVRLFRCIPKQGMIGPGPDRISMTRRGAMVGVKQPTISRLLLGNQGTEIGWPDGYHGYVGRSHGNHRHHRCPRGVRATVIPNPPDDGEHRAGDDIGLLREIADRREDIDRHNTYQCQ